MLETVLTNARLKQLAKKEAWAPEALLAEGIPENFVNMMLVDVKRAKPERARLSVTGRRRTEPTLLYIWGPDIPFLLGRGEKQ